MTQTGLIVIGIAGTVVALDRTSGQELWRTNLKGGDFTNVVLQVADLFATSKGELFCLDPATGSIRWQNPLKGLGRGLVTIAAAGGQQTVLMREKRQRDDLAEAAEGSAAAIG